MKAPKHLKTAARRMWEEILSEFDVDDSAGLSLLEAACSSYQRAEDARALVRKEGLTIVDRFGQVKAHPACGIERDARGQMITALRALKLAPEDL